MYKKITSVDEALKRHPEKIDIKKATKALSFLPEKYLRGMIALLTLQAVVFVVNNDDPKKPEWKPDYNDNDQRKWFPWYTGGDSSGAGFRFVDSYYFWSDSSADGGARLALKDEDRAEHMNKYFQDLYKELYLVLE